MRPRRVMSASYVTGYAVGQPEPSLAATHRTPAPTANPMPLAPRGQNRYGRVPSRGMDPQKPCTLSPPSERERESGGIHLQVVSIDADPSADPAPIFDAGGEADAKRASPTRTPNKLRRKGSTFNRPARERERSKSDNESAPLGNKGRPPQRRLVAGGNQMAVLLVPERTVDIVTLEQLLMTADVMDFALIEHQDCIALHQR